MCLSFVFWIKIFTVHIWRQCTLSIYLYIHLLYPGHSWLKCCPSQEKVCQSFTRPDKYYTTILHTALAAIYKFIDKKNKLLSCFSRNTPRKWIYVCRCFSRTYLFPSLLETHSKSCFVELSQKFSKQLNYSMDCMLSSECDVHSIIHIFTHFFLVMLTVIHFAPVNITKKHAKHGFLKYRKDC